MSVAVGETVEDGDGVVSRGRGGEGDDDLRPEADAGRTLAEIGGREHSEQRLRPGRRTGLVYGRRPLQSMGLDASPPAYAVAGATSARGGLTLEIAAVGRRRGGGKPGRR